jgi:ribosomal protein L40E
MMARKTKEPSRKVEEDEDEDLVLICDHCDTQNPPEARYCNECGGEFVDDDDDDE